MAKKQITVKGLTIQIDEIRDQDYVSLTDIARKSSEEPRFQIMSWLKNRSTIEFLETWEDVHNPDFKRDQMVTFKDRYLQNRNLLTPQKWVEETGAVGLISRSGRHGGGTWAHAEIALNFCYWLSPAFQVYFFKEFQRLKAEESLQKSVEWHIDRITDLVDETRNWLDTIPGQKRNRLS